MLATSERAVDPSPGSSKRPRPEPAALARTAADPPSRAGVLSREARFVAVKTVTPARGFW